MKKIIVNLGKRSYPIVVGSKLLQTIDQETSFAITNKTVREINGKFLKCPVLEIEDSEKAKNLKTIENLCKQLVELGADRDSKIIAFGGGVVGDVAGFVASIFMRGVKLVQVPTTLLAQVDSSIGGKTGVNLPQGKNLIGTFHQPGLVVSDVSALKTLPKKEIKNGLAEIVKCAIIADADLFGLLERNLEKIFKKDEKILEEIVARCAGIKAKIVKEDELEQNEKRIALNLGHTFGHAIEKLSNFKISHGEAVAIGIAKAAELGCKDAKRIKELLGKIGLPTKTEFSNKELVEAMKTDKKKKRGKLRIIVPEKIGKVCVREI